MYAKTTELQNSLKAKKRQLEPYHHVKLDTEFINDCQMWEIFLEEQNHYTICRPFMDLSVCQSVEQLSFTSDASANKDLGFGMVFDKELSFGQWEPGYIKRYEPSIGYLELYTLCSAVFIWSHKLRDRRVLVSCDNMSAVQMVNSTTSSCKNCMYLLQMLTLQSLRYNFRIYARHLKGILNGPLDALSRLQLNVFFNKYAKQGTKNEPERLPKELCLH